MNRSSKLWFAGSVGLLSALGLWWIARSPVEQVAPDAGAVIATGDVAPHSSDPPMVISSAGIPAAASEEVEKTPIDPVVAPLSIDEQHKEIDRKNMRLLHAAIFEYKKVHGRFPEYLSQLAPQFVEEAALHSPRRRKEGGQEQLSVHPDPGMAKPSYAFEFSNVVFRDGRTFAEIKEVQRAEWGDVVPMLRRFGHDKVINMSYGGDLYETALNWEWDSATLDVVAKSGWGPGLDDGKFTTVQVLGASGQPLPNAQVWADGRNYSFDLPNRPFTTDAKGFARIPLGSDLDRTALVLRFEGYGQASAAVAFPLGEPPEAWVLKASLSRPVGGTVLDAAGQPMAETWVQIKRPASDGKTSGVSLGVVKTDANGRWKASLHPDDAARFNLAVGSGSRPAKFLAGQKVDAYAAASGHAVTTVEVAGRLPPK